MALGDTAWKTFSTILTLSSKWKHNLGRLAQGRHVQAWGRVWWGELRVGSTCRAAGPRWEQMKIFTPGVWASFAHFLSEAIDYIMRLQKCGLGKEVKFQGNIWLLEEHWKDGRKDGGDGCFKLALVWFQEWAMKLSRQVCNCIWPLSQWLQSSSARDHPLHLASEPMAIVLICLNSSTMHRTDIGQHHSSTVSGDSRNYFFPSKEKSQLIPSSLRVCEKPALSPCRRVNMGPLDNRIHPLVLIQWTECTGE